MTVAVLKEDETLIESIELANGDLTEIMAEIEVLQELMESGEFYEDIPADL